MSSYVHSNETCMYPRMTYLKSFGGEEKCYGFK